MPIYEYVCRNDDCRHTMEVMRPIKQAGAPEVCPFCNGYMVRVISKSTFRMGDKKLGVKK